MAHYPFSERPDMLVFTCAHFLDGKADITKVCHHWNDNMWEFVCDGEHTDEDAVVMSVGELCELDSTLGLLCDLPVGACAVRKSKAFAWEYGRIDGEDFYDAAASRMN